jgi:hypothetical protein
MPPIGEDALVIRMARKGIGPQSRSFAEAEFAAKKNEKELFRKLVPSGGGRLFSPGDVMFLVGCVTVVLYVKIGCLGIGIGKTNGFILVYTEISAIGHGEKESLRFCAR